MGRPRLRGRPFGLPENGGVYAGRNDSQKSPEQFLGNRSGLFVPPGDRAIAAKGIVSRGETTRSIGEAQKNRPAQNNAINLRDKKAFFLILKYAKKLHLLLERTFYFIKSDADYLKFS